MLNYFLKNSGKIRKADLPCFDSAIKRTTGPFITADNSINLLFTNNSKFNFLRLFKVLLFRYRGKYILQRKGNQKEIHH